MSPSQNVTSTRIGPGTAKYVQIREELAGSIRSGVYAPGQQIPSEGDFVKRYMCSRPTVVRAIQDLVGRGVLVRKHGRGTFVSNNFDLVLDSKRSIVLITPFEISSGTYAAMADGVSGVAQNQGYRFQIQATGNDASRFSRSVEEAVRHPEAVGVILVPLFDQENMPLNEQAIRRLVQSGIPTVLVNHKVPGVGEQLPFVGSEDRAAAHALASHLIQRGHRRIGFIRATSAVSSDQDRYEGYLQALDDADIACDERYVMHVVSHDLCDQGILEIERLLQLHDPPTAIMCGYDVIAANAMRWLLEHGYVLPRDMAVVGFSDDIGMYTTPTLTTATQPMKQIGSTACRTLVDIIEGKPAPNHDLLIPSSPVYRQSTCTTRAVYSVKNDASPELALHPP